MGSGVTGPYLDEATNDIIIITFSTIERYLCAFYRPADFNSVESYNQDIKDSAGEEWEGKTPSQWDRKNIRGCFDVADQDRLL